MIKNRFFEIIFFSVILFSCNKGNEEIKEYWTNGKAKISFTYSNSDTSTYLKKEFYENGLVMAETNFENSKKNGKDKWWFKNKQLGKDELYNDGKLIKFASWYENGVKEGEGSVIAIDTIVDKILGIETHTIIQFGNIVFWKENGRKDYEMNVIDSVNATVKKWDDEGGVTIEKYNRYNR
jgi:antitoxin component YwqK of YwqJK toxin-antitoxin module